MPKCMKCGKEFEIVKGGSAMYCGSCFDETKKELLEEYEAKKKKLETEKAEKAKKAKEEEESDEEVAESDEICPVCGEWGCTLHANESKKAAVKFVMGMINAEILEYLRAHDPALAKEVEAGEEVDLHTGEFSKGEEVAKEEEEEEEEEWLPAPPPIAIKGGTSMFVKREDDVEKPKDEHATSHLEFIKDDMFTLSTGTVRSFRMFRAKPNGVREGWIREAAMPLVPRLKRQLMMAFEAEARIARVRGTKAGKIDAGLSSKVVTEGSSEVFSKKASKRTISTAVQIVLDSSGSMDEAPGGGVVFTHRAGREKAGHEYLIKKTGCAAILAYALGEVCSQLNIPFEIISMQSKAWFWSNVYGIEYKRFNEPWAAAKGKIGAYVGDANIDLPHEAAQWAAGRLLKRTEDRRIMFFLSDALEYNVGVDLIGEFASELKRKVDVRMVGVGILADQMEKYMKEKSVIVMKLDELTDAVFTKLAKIIHPH